MIQILNPTALDEKQTKILAACLHMDYGEEVFQENTPLDENQQQEKRFAALWRAIFSELAIPIPFVGVQINLPGHMKTHIVEYRRLPGVKIMVFNYRFFQFLEEYLWYMNHPSYEALLTLFCRNLIPLEARSGQEQAARFYEWVEKNYGKPFPHPIPGSSALLSSAIFILFHEIAHMIPDLKDATTQFIDFMDSLGVEDSFLFYPENGYPGIEEFERINYKEEVSCDYFAFANLYKYGFARIEGAEESELSLAYMALCAEAIYQIFEQMTSSLINLGDSKLRLALSRLGSDVVSCRIANLNKLVQLYPNPKYNHDYSSALLTNGREATHKIIRFFEDVEQFLIHYPEYQKLYQNEKDRLQ